METNPMISELAWYLDMTATRTFREPEPQPGPDQSSASLRARLRQALTVPPRAEAVVAFWFEAGPAQWFAKQPEFDETFRDRFIAEHEAAARGDLMDWMAWPEAALALLILLDQFPRNAFRGTPRMYATDALARELAASAVEAGYDRQVRQGLELFFYLPFSHSEDIRDQERGVALCSRLRPSDLAHAEGHRDIIRRFGRFPHRNPILGRTMTAEEQRFLDEGGFAG
jgi:uncharacterized protein (DUF924 family)